MGIENPVHLLFLGAVALIVLGPKRLPELARAAGKGMREFRESLNGEGHVDESPAGGVVVQPGVAHAQAQLPPAQSAPAPAAQPALVAQPAPPAQDGEPLAAADSPPPA
ncbi:MAG TPA: twin-arginine translocase TatA/TatE family subunit [Solirubrobacteraceae bacterium]